MAEYIEKEALLKEVYRIGNHPWSEWETAGVVSLVSKQPTIEAEPVKHGHWLWDGKHFYCSVCSGTRYHDLVLGMDAAYCPYCGAKLEDVEDGTK